MDKRSTFRTFKTYKTPAAAEIGSKKRRPWRLLTLIGSVCVIVIIFQIWIVEEYITGPPFTLQHVQANESWSHLIFHATGDTQIKNAKQTDNGTKELFGSPANRNKNKNTSLPSKQPNIVFILADDYGYHDIGYHGKQYGGLIKTPVMDRLAAEGVILENYYVQPICTPTRVQLMSGRYQIHTGLQHFIIEHAQPNCLPTDEITMPQKLKEAGYSTHMVGKWHAGFHKAACLPHRRGFDTFFGLWLGGGDHYKHETHCGPCGCPGTGYDLHENDCIADSSWKGKYSTTIFTDRAIKIIQNQPTDMPLFLYVAYQAVHDPMQAPKEYVNMYSNITHDVRKTYSAMVTYMDYSIGRIVDVLKTTGNWENTVLIFSSDNGGDTVHGINWPLRGKKKTLWEGGLRANGFVNSPLIPSSARGRVSHDLIHVTDWFPTFVDGLAGGKLNGTKPLDGYNIWETIRDMKPSPRTEILHNIDPMLSTSTLSEVAGDSNLFNSKVNAAIRVGDWKLITNEPTPGIWSVPPELSGKLTESAADKTHHPIWLFNIKEDPLETQNLSQTYPDKVNELLRRLQAYNVTSVPVVYPKCDQSASPSRHGNLWVPWGEPKWRDFVKRRT
ncbi:arylsulfatase B-like [Amphiura filiformis]|uniref:arylsulfatase B-like n=1 Tax=Amphiura filiformis TaxID=82378 RepID=UPI003B2112DD